MNAFFFAEEIKEAQRQYFFRSFGISVSEQFMKCADLQLRRDFELKTGLKITKNISMAWMPPEKFFYQKERISKFPAQIYINHNWNPVIISWKSRSGRIYSISDLDIDCNDIELWFENLDPLLYHRQLFPDTRLPFNLKNLSFDLVVERLNIDCTIRMFLRKEKAGETSSLIRQIDSFIDSFNKNSEKNNKEPGVVHNWQRYTEEDKIYYEIDTGLAGPHFLKKLLPFLSKLYAFNRIEIT